MSERAFIRFDSSYAPCGFLIVREGADPHDESQTCLIQTDWDWPGVASSIGWVPCKCGATDGTVPCVPCERTVSTMIAEAYNYIRKHTDEPFEALADYITDENS